MELTQENVTLTDDCPRSPAQMFSDLDRSTVACDQFKDGIECFRSWNIELDKAFAHPFEYWAMSIVLDFFVCNKQYQAWAQRKHWLMIEVKVELEIVKSGATGTYVLRDKSSESGNLLSFDGVTGKVTKIWGVDSKLVWEMDDQGKLIIN